MERSVVATTVGGPSGVRHARGGRAGRPHRRRRAARRDAARRRAPLAQPAARAAAAGHDVTMMAARMAAVLERARAEAQQPWTTDAGVGGDLADPRRVGVVQAEHLERVGLVCGVDDAAEAAAHVEDLVHLVVADVAELGDQPEDRRDRQRRVDAVADVGVLQAEQVVEPAGGQVGEAVDVGLRADEVHHGLDVDLGRLQQDVAEGAAEPVVVERDVGQCLAGERVAVGVEPGGGEADQRVAGLHLGAGDHRVEVDDPDAGAREVQSADQVPELRELAADDLDARRARRRGRGRRRSRRATAASALSTAR